MAEQSTGVPMIGDLRAEKTDVVPLPIVDAPTVHGAAMLGLVCVVGELLGRTVRIGGAPVMIGRGQADVVIQGSQVSRQHARITRIGSVFQVEDLGSANGTFVNGVRIERPVMVAVGDRLQIATTMFTFVHHDELRDRIERLQRLEAMGALAGGLAHDFNNALAVIVAELEFVDEAVPASAQAAREALVAIRGATDAGSALAKRLVRLGRTDPLTVDTVRLTSLIDMTSAIVRRKSHGRVAVRARVGEALAVFGSHEELHNVLVNLYVNAVDAMPDGGVISVTARALELSPADAVTRHVPMAGAYVELAVRDSGSGMDDATMARLFEPFFTTKAVGHGNGLGLAMVHGAVRRHGGAIEVSSKVGHGTTFTILLQRAQIA